PFQTGHRAVIPQCIVRALILLIHDKVGGNADAIQSGNGGLECGVGLVMCTRGPHALAHLSSFLRSGVTSVKYDGVDFDSTELKCDGGVEPVVDFEVPLIPVVFERAA